MITRRFFLKSSGLALVSSGSPRRPSSAAAYAAEPPPARRPWSSSSSAGPATGSTPWSPTARSAYYALRPIDRDPGAPRRQQGRGPRPRRLLRPAPGPRAPAAAVEGEEPGRRSTRRQPRRHALALRRPGLHGERHSGPQVHRGRLDEPPACRPRPTPRATPFRGRRHDPDAAPLPGRARSGGGHGQHPRASASRPAAGAAVGRAASRRCTTARCATCCTAPARRPSRPSTS